MTRQKKKPTKENALYHFNQQGFYGLKETMTTEQERFVESIITTPVTFSNAKAGTGKTLMAYAALDLLRDVGVIDSIYYVFSPVSEGKMGFRPGTQQEKSLDYSAPLSNAIKKIGQNPYQELDEKSGRTSVVSHTFLRGDTFENAGIIIDEAQNYTVAELQKSLTRISDSCHVIIIGHDGQVDLEYGCESGFVHFLKHFSQLSDDKVRVVDLHKNFRGWIADHADNIKQSFTRSENDVLDRAVKLHLKDTSRNDTQDTYKNEKAVLYGQGAD